MAPTTRTAPDVTIEKYAKIAEEAVGKAQGEPIPCLIDHEIRVDLLIHEGEYGSVIWSDHENPFPELLPKGENDHEPHSRTIIKYQGGQFPRNFKGAVCYVDGRDSESRKWIVAFDFATKKVWVDASPLGPIDWNVVEIKLSESTDKMLSEDPVRKGVAYANFTQATPYAGFYSG